jgi:hypothetical protein
MDSHITYRANGEAASFVGLEAVTLFQMASIKGMLRLHSVGLKRRGGIRPVIETAQRLTGETSKKIPVLIEALDRAIAQAKEQIPYVPE